MIPIVEGEYKYGPTLGEFDFKEFKKNPNDYLAKYYHYGEEATDEEQKNFLKSFRNRPGFKKVLRTEKDRHFMEVTYVPDKSWADEFYSIGILNPRCNNLEPHLAYDIKCFTTKDEYEHRRYDKSKYAEVMSGGWNAAVAKLKELLTINGFEDYANTL